MFDPTPAQLAGLQPAARARAVVLLNHFRKHGVPLVITDLGGRRQIAEQRALLNQGRTRTLNSAHLSGLAFDFDVLGESRDSVPPELWKVLGASGESLGLIWGGRWGWDFGHFELPR